MQLAGRADVVGNIGVQAEGRTGCRDRLSGDGSHCVAKAFRTGHVTMKAAGEMMRAPVVLMLVAELTAAAAWAAPGDAARGGQLLDALKCNGCHQFAPRWSMGHPAALERLLKSPLTPARFAERVWNHAPKMWSATQEAGVGFPGLSEQQASDLLTWFFAAGYFDPAGDERRGERVFTRGGCHVCHLMEGNQGGGPGVSEWNISNYPALLVGLWSHWPAMNAAMGRRRLVWPSVDSAQMRDLMAFVQSRFPAKLDPEMRAGDEKAGRLLFVSKGCAKCHPPGAGADAFPQYRGFTELAASFWNHIPMMTRAPQPLNRAEMSDIVAYLWSVRYFEEIGSAKRGARIFQSLRCGECHAAPVRADFRTSSMIAALWKHTPEVMEKMREKKIGWPKFAGTEVEDLIAHFASGTR